MSFGFNFGFNRDCSILLRSLKPKLNLIADCDEYIWSRKTKPHTPSQIFFEHYVYGSQQLGQGSTRCAIWRVLDNGEVNRPIMGSAPLHPPRTTWQMR